MKYKLIALIALAPLCTYAASDLKDLKGFHIINNPTLMKSAASTNGFVETKDQDTTISFFLGLKKRAAYEMKAFNASKKDDTHLKQSFDQISLSIPFSKLNGISDSEIIGYAAIGSYKNGWTGIRTFFDKNTLGICSYSVEKFIGINADAKSVKYLVNKKPSFSSIEGNYNSGFLYTLSWNDDMKDSVIDHKLECVNKNMNTEILNKMILLANKIDSR